MLRAPISVIEDVTGGELLTGDRSGIVTGLAVDSRLVDPGMVFIALPGERVDGHDFLEAALERGARVLVVTKPMTELADSIERASSRRVAVIRVEDATRALQSIAAWHRSRLRCVVVGITGSTGKTTTKDFLAHSFPEGTCVVFTVGNRNNEIGVPLTLLSADADCDVLIVEMGMRGHGQITDLAKIAMPTMGLVTNVGTSHIEILGSQDRIATAKGELVRAIPASGGVFLNGDDAYTDALALDSAAPVTRYGVGAQNRVRAENITSDTRGVAEFDLVVPGGSAHIRLPVPGRHNVYNALAAASVATAIGVPVELVSEGIGSARLSAMRMEMVDTARGVTVMNDAYNANPSSMRAAVETLSAIAARGKRVAVLGDMAELGSLSELAHFSIGEEVARRGVDVLVTVGRAALRISDGARADGMAADRIRPCASAEEAIEVLDDLLEDGDVVLVKASRVMGLESVVEGIVSPRV